MADKPPRTTNDAGNPVASDEFSLTVGPDGPIVLQDQYLIEQMANFNRERIPERQPHAKGSGAFGVFETTEDVSAYTRAALFQPGRVMQNPGTLYVCTFRAKVHVSAREILGRGRGNIFSRPETPPRHRLCSGTDAGVCRQGRKRRRPRRAAFSLLIL